MKRWAKTLLLALALGAFTVARADGPYQVQVVSPFGTLNNTDSALAVSGAQAQDLLNVDLSPNGKSVKTRKGFASAYSLAITTSGTHGVYQFYQSGGSDVSLFANDTRLSASVGGASPTVLFSTGTLNATYQCVDSGGFAYCNNTGRTSLIKTDGTAALTTSIQTVNSTGTMVAVTQERLVTAGFSEAPNRIDFSKKNDFATWTPGGFSYDPIQWTITSPGSKITHITFANGRIYWFKESSYGYILEGPEHIDWKVTVRSSNIGTLYNTSIYKDDVLYFQGQDGHFYADDGSNLTKMSRDIQGTIDVTQGRVPGAWTQTTASDWNAGSFDSSLFVDTDTTSGTIGTVFPDSFSTFQTTATSSRPIWSFYTTHTGGASTATVVSGALQMVSDTSTGSVVIKTYGLLPDFQPGTTYHFRMTAASGASPAAFGLFLSPTSTTGFPEDLANYWKLYFPFNGPLFFENIVNTTSGQISTPHLAVTSSIPFDVDFYISTTTYQVSINGSVAASGTHSWSHTPVYVYLTAYNGGTFSIDNFTVVPQTFTFVSQVKNAPSLSSWDTFQANASSLGGSNTFSIRGATGAFTINSSTPSNWTTITSGSIPTISTASYFQIRDYVATNSTSSTVNLSDFTQNWFEGSATDKTYACYNDNALWWSVASGAGATTNNRILKYDLINQGWLIYDIATGGMLVRNQRLYFGSPTTGTIYKFGDATSDNGSAINSYWKSRDFFGTDPFTDKEFWRMSISAKGVSNSTMTVTYQLNGNTSTSFNVSTTEGSNTSIKRNLNFPLSTIGSVINIKFGNNAADQPFEVFGSQIEYTNKSWQPEEN